MKIVDLLGLELKMRIPLFWSPLFALEGLLRIEGFKPRRLEMHRGRYLMVGVHRDQEPVRRWDAFDLQ